MEEGGEDLPSNDDHRSHRSRLRHLSRASHVPGFSKVNNVLILKSILICPEITILLKKNIIPEITSMTRNIRISVLRMDLLMMLLYQGNFLTKMKFDLCDKITTSYIGSIYFLLLLYFGSLSLSERSSFLAWAQLIVLWLPCLWQRLQLCIVFCI